MDIVLTDGAKISCVMPKTLTEHQMFRPTKKILAYNHGMGIVLSDGPKISGVTPKILTEHKNICGVVLKECPISLRKVQLITTGWA